MTNSATTPSFPDREWAILQSLTGTKLYSEPFWDDDHISSRMLAAHLDPDFEGASRKHEFIRRSADWIASRMPTVEGKQLLDLGCGPGLYAKLFRDQGFSVTGIDCSRRSIAYAIKHSPPDIEYRCGDYLETPLPAGMDVVTLIYCDFGALLPKFRRLLLRKIRKALAPGGRFIFDVFTPQAYADYTDGNCIERAPQGGFWSPDPYVCITRKRSYRNNTTFLRHIAVLTAGKTRFYQLRDHAFSREELRANLQIAGFSRVDFLGDLAGAPDTSESPTIGIVAEV